MVRVRKEKGAASAPAPSASSGKVKSSKKSRSGDTALQEQVLALGGTKADYDLVKNSKEPTQAGPSNSDASYGSFTSGPETYRSAPSPPFQKTSPSF